MMCELTPEEKKNWRKATTTQTDKGEVRLTIKKNVDYGEYQVKYHLNGKWMEDETYFTDDKEDAICTRKAMLVEAKRLHKKKSM